MLAALGEPAPPRSGIMGWLRDRLKPRPPRASVRQAWGIDYLAIECFAPMTQRSWWAIAALAREADGLLLPEELSPPEGMELPLAREDGRFAAAQCIATTAALLGASGLPPPRRVLGLIDLPGRRQREAGRLLRDCAALIVMTEHPERYEALCEEGLADCGAPVVLCSVESDLRACAVVAAPDGLTPPQCKTLLPLVVSARPLAAPARAPVISGLACGEDVVRVLPSGIAATRLAALLYERGGASWLGETPALWGRLEGRQVNFPQMARQIAQMVEI